MLGMTSGEAFVILFILFAVVSAPWWPRLGESLAVKLTGIRERDATDAEGGASK